MCSPRRYTHCLCLSALFCFSWVTLFVSFLFWYPVKCTWGLCHSELRVWFVMGHGDLRTAARSHWQPVPWWMTQALWRHETHPLQKHHQSGSRMWRQVKEGDEGEEEEWWEHQAKIKRSVCSCSGSFRETPDHALFIGLEKQNQHLLRCKRKSLC